MLLFFWLLNLLVFLSAMNKKKQKTNSLARNLFGYRLAVIRIRCDSLVCVSIEHLHLCLLAENCIQRDGLLYHLCD